MKRVDAFCIADGTLYPSQGLAERAAQTRYDAVMTGLQHDLIEVCESHSNAFRVMKWIEENFDRVAIASKLKLDMLVENPEDDE